MEQFPQEDYIALHRITLVGLLDGAEAVALYHEPAVRLHSSGLEDVFDLAQIEGININSYDLSTDIGKRATAEVKMAAVDLNGFRSSVSASLTMAYIDNHPEQYGDMAPGPLQQSIYEISAETLRAVLDVPADYARSDFIDRDTDGGFIIRTMHVRRPDGSVLARELVLTVTDGLVDRVLSVLAVGDSLEVRQDIDPAENEVLRAMTQFFVIEHGDEEGLQGVLAAFWTEALSGAAVDLGDVYARYPGARERTILDGFVMQLRAEVEAVRNSMLLRKTSPELTLPSSEELAAYAELIAAARG